MTYTRLSIQEFGSQLLDTLDLDPVYVALVGCHWPLPQLYRWLVAYWCFYNCGFASWMCENPGNKFWPLLKVAAINEEPAPIGGRWPRGRERRHFRGQKCFEAITSLEYTYKSYPHEMVEDIVSKAPNYQAVSKQVQTHPMFGPWIGFKVADMIDRVLGIHIDFTEAAVFMFKDPVKAAIMYSNQRCGYEPKPEIHPELSHCTLNRYIIPTVTGELITYFHGVMAPPLYDRMVNIQEVETILCKWKSHINGHYPVGLDNREIREGVEPWVPYSKAAAQFLEAMPSH